MKNQLQGHLKNKSNPSKTNVTYTVLCFEMNGRRGLLGLAVGYVLLPFDLIPDFIPVVGVLGDLIVVPLLVVGVRKLIPEGLVEEHRRSQRPDGTSG